MSIIDALLIIVGGMLVCILIAFAIQVIVFDEKTTDAIDTVVVMVSHEVEDEISYVNEEFYLWM